MTLRRKSLYALAALFVVATLFTLSSRSVPSPRTDEQLRMASPAPIAEPRAQIVNSTPVIESSAKFKSGIVGGLATAQASDGPLRDAYAKLADAPDRKIIRNADLSMVVKDVRDSAAQIVHLVTAGGGQVDNLNIAETNYGCFSGTLVVRVPSTELEDAIAHFKGLALRAEKEQITARDVASEFYDGEAHLRNLRAEEQQYLAIMKQSGKIPDTLEVAQHLSDVRDRIERQQAAIQVMTHDIEMSQISITLSKQVDTKIAGFEWRPLQNARVAMREALIGLGDWFDLAVAFLIKLPLMIVWALTVACALWIVYAICRSIWRRLRHLVPAIEPTSKLQS